MKDRNYYYKVNTFQNEEPTEIEGHIICENVIDAIEILKEQDILTNEGWEFLEFSREQVDFLWRFFWDCGCWGVLEGLFVATNEEVENIIGKEVDFGEVLGKHSDIFGDIAAKDIRKVNAKESFIHKGVEIFGRTWSGYNPIEFYEQFNFADEEDEA